MSPSAPKKGDVVCFEDHEYVVDGICFGPDGFQLVLIADDGNIEMARPRDVTLVGDQLPLMDEQP